MGKLVVGDFLPDFAYDTPFEKGRSISEAVEKKTKTVLLFLRYYGCTMCQLDIHELASNYDKIVAKGAQALVVLQSDSENLATQLQKKDALPFDIICDPEQRLYKKFEITPAVSMKKMMDAKSVIKAVKATTKGYKHGFMFLWILLPVTTFVISFLIGE